MLPLVANENTVQELRVSVNCDVYETNDGEWDHNKFASDFFRLRGLRVLSLTGSGLVCMTEISCCALAETCPQLEALGIGHGSESNLSDAAAAELLGLPRLRVLSLLGVRFNLGRALRRCSRGVLGLTHVGLFDTIASHHYFGTTDEQLGLADLAARAPALEMAHFDGPVYGRAA